MRITDRLKVEHGVFLLQVRHLEDLVKRGAPAEALRATLETVATAEEWHTLIEDRLLYPALAETLGADNALLQEVEQDHRALRALSDKVRSGEFRAGRRPPLHAEAPHASRKGDPRPLRPRRAEDLPRTALLDVQLGRGAHLRGSGQARGVAPIARMSP